MRLCVVLLSWLIGAANAGDSPLVSMMPQTGGHVARFVADRGSVAVIELSGNYDRDAADGTFNVEPRALVATEFLRYHPDNYDALVVFTGFPIETGDAVAFQHSVKNDVQGIGRPAFDNSSFYGSASKLQSYIDMADLSKYQTDPLNVDFDFTLQVFAHEFMHQFASYVGYRRPDGSRSDALLGRDNTHWSYLLQTDASLMYGNRWHDNGNGTFAATAVREIYSPLDLYLMGLLRPEEVPPFYLIEAPAVDRRQLPQLDAVVAGVRRDITVEDIIAVEGSRIPDWQYSQKDFRLAFIYLVRPGQSPPPEDIAALSGVRREIGMRFSALTGGRANANVFAEPALTGAIGAPISPLPPNLPPANAVDFDTGLRWLKQRQSAEGWWADDRSTTSRDTSVALTMLASLEPEFPGLVIGVEWLDKAAAPNNDYLARALAANATVGRTSVDEDAVARLLGNQNPDGGWGLGPGYGSNPLDTGLVLQALHWRSANDRTARDRGVQYLLSQQNADGGWGQSDAGASRTTVTAKVLYALREDPSASVAVTAAVRFLASRQNADGGFGDSPSTVHDTAHALQSLMALDATGEVQADKAVQYLSVAQRADGSWQGSVYSTALALDTLARANAMNWTIVAFSASPGTTTDGQRVTLRATVRNTGNLPAPPGKIRFYDGDPAAGGSPVGVDADVPLLAPGGSASASSSWGTFGKAGVHQLHAVVDPDRTIEELSVGDNSAVLTYVVNAAGALTDLLVSNDDLFVSPARPTQIPANLTVSALLTNAGETDADNVCVVLWEGQGADRVQAGESIIGIPGRSTRPLTFPAVLRKSGTTVYTLEIDPDGAVLESDKTNNQASIDVSTESALDLEVLPEDISVDKPTAHVGDDLTFKVQIRNRGTSDIDSFGLRYSVLDETSETVVLANTLHIASGQALEQTFPWRATHAGSLSFKVALDPDNQVTETDESNNAALLPFTVIAAHGPNLAVSYRDLRAEPAPALEGRQVKLSVLLRNTGTQPVANAELAFYLGDPANQGQRIGRTETADLPAGGSQTLLFDWLVPDAPDKLIFAVADPDNRIPDEYSKSDNQAFITLPVRAMADLAIAAGDLQLTPAVPRPGEAATLAVKVSNLGQQPAANVLVRAYDGVPGEGGIQIGGDETIALLPEQASATVSFAFQFAADPGLRALYVQVDPLEAVPERYIANNNAALAVTAQSGDFSVSRRYFSPNGDGVLDTTDFSFRLKAPGDVTVRVVKEGSRIVRHHRDAGWSSVSGGVWTWDGLDDDGSLVRDDEYRIQAIDPAGLVHGEARVVLDTNRAPLLDAVGTPYGVNMNLTCRIPQALGFDLAKESWGNGYPSVEDMVGIPDGSAYFFIIGDRYGQDDLPSGVYRINEWGGDLRLIAADQGVGDHGHWRQVRPSLDGSRIAVLRDGYYDQGGAWIPQEIWWASADGQGLRRLDLGLIRPLQLLDFSAAGDELYFTAMSGSPHAVLHAFSFPSSTVRNLDAPGGYQWSLSPNRKTAYGNGYIVDLPSGARTALPEGDAEGDARWSPDSSHLSILTADRDLAIYDAAGQRLVDLKGLSWNTSVSWSEDSRHLNLTTEEDCDDRGLVCGRGVIRRLHIDTGEWEEMFGETYRVPTDYSCDCDYDGPTIYHDVIPGRDQLRVDVSLGGKLPETDREAHGTRAPVDISAVLETGPPYERQLFTWPASGGPVPDSVFAEYGRALYYSKPWAPADGGACVEHNGEDWWVFRSLQNLTVDLRVRRTEEGAVLMLNGTAADMNFARYVLEYSDVSRPGVWLPVAPSSADPVIDGPLGQWVPPGPGTYVIRLTVEDLAGNVRQAIKRVGWGENAVITDLYRSPQFISPNGDGIQDKAILHYHVVEPVNLEFVIYNARGERVRTMTRSHPAIAVEADQEWDGRDERGEIVPDGEYRLTVLGYEFSITVDATPPAAPASSTSMLRMSEPIAACPSNDPDRGFVCAAPSLEWDVLDTNFAGATVRTSEGTEPATWNVLVESRDAKGELGPPVLSLADYVQKRFRIEARDRAGNASVELAPAGVERFDLLGYRTDWLESNRDGLRGFPLERDLWGDFRPAPDFIIQFEDQERGLILQLAESVRAPLARVTVEYVYTGDVAAGPPVDGWSAVQVDAFYSSNQSMAGFTGRPDGYLTIPSDPQAVPPDHLFLIRWGLQELVAEGVYYFRVKALAQDGRTFYSTPYPIRKESIFEITKAERGLYGMTVHAFEKLGRFVSSIDLQISNPSDPFFATPRIVASMPGAPDLRGLGAFRFDLQDRFLTCVTYQAVLIAHLTDGSTVKSSPAGISNCDVVESTVDPVPGACGETPPGKLRIGLQVKPLRGEASGIPIQHLVFGRLRDDGSEDIHFNVVEPQEGQAYSFELDTKDIPDGRYGHFARATDIDGRHYTSPVQITSDHVPVQARITYPLQDQRVCGRPLVLADGSATNGVFIEGELTDEGGFDYVLEYGNGAQPSTWQALPATLPECFTEFNQVRGAGSRACPTGSRLGGHRVTGPLGAAVNAVTGDVAVRLKARDWGGHQVCRQISFAVDAGVQAGQSAVDRRLFSPGTASAIADVTVQYEAGESLTVDAEVYEPRDLEYADDGRIVVGFLAAPLRALAQQMQIGGGPDAHTWDGTDDAGAYVPDGEYVLVLRLQDGCGNRRIEAFRIEVDRTPPRVTIDYPRADDPLTQVVEVVGSASDSNFAGHVLELGEGVDPQSWLPLDRSPGQASSAVLGRWNTYNQAGHFTLRLRASDAAGNDAETRVTLNLAARTELLTYYEAQPDPFSPNGDGRRDAANLRFDLAAPAIGTLILYSGDTPVRTLASARPLAAGPATIGWDGADDAGTPLPDQDYRATIEIVSADNVNLRQTASVTVRLDRTPPTIQLSQPSGAYVRAIQGVVGSIRDDSLSAYAVTLQGLDPAHAPVMLDNGHDQRTAYRFADLAGLPDGMYRITMTADDEAENRSELTLEFELDNTPPQVALVSPAAGAAVSAKAGPLGIAGTVGERNLKQYTLRLGQGPPPAGTLLATGAQLPLPAPLHMLDPGLLADGPYTLQLAVEDKAGWTNQASVAIVVDNTSPTAMVKTPTDGALVRAPIDVLGTAADANLKQYVLEVAPGAKGQASRWTRIGTGDVEVADGKLGRLTALPPDGVHTLRLTVADEAANTASALVQFSVDTTPPASPVGLAATVQSRQDVVLTWTPNAQSDLAGYAVYRDGTRTGQDLVDVASYTDVGVVEGKHTYHVTAIDKAGNESRPSNQANVTISLASPVAQILSPNRSGVVAGMIDIKGTAYSPRGFKEYRLLIRTLTLDRTQVGMTTGISVMREIGYWVQAGLRPSSEKAFC